jgi:hypothetical protein
MGTASAPNTSLSDRADHGASATPTPSADSSPCARMMMSRHERQDARSAAEPKGSARRWRRPTAPGIRDRRKSFRWANAATNVRSTRFIFCPVRWWRTARGNPALPRGRSFVCLGSRVRVAAWSRCPSGRRDEKGDCDACIGRLQHRRVAGLRTAPRSENPARPGSSSAIGAPSPRTRLACWYRSARRSRRPTAPGRRDLGRASGGTPPYP